MTARLGEVFVKAAVGLTVLTSDVAIDSRGLVERSGVLVVTGVVSKATE